MQSLIDKIKLSFADKFGIPSNLLLVQSPGRVNLIGEHTDYNEGFVIPAAIDKCIIFAVAPNQSKQWRFYSADLDRSMNYEIGMIQHSNERWANYLLGILDQLCREGFEVPGIDCVFGGNIPIGAGMSSSAALEAGFLFALNELFDFKLDKLSIVKLAQKAENEFVGVKCGIMDQFTNIFGCDHHVIKLDCRSLEYEYFPFVRDDLRIVLCDTHVHHELGSSQYNLRREQCDEGVKKICKYHPEVKSLRDVNIELIEKYKNELSPIVYKRCKYVIEENERVIHGCVDLKKNDFISFGKRMNESHKGLRDEYEVSCSELNVLVDIAVNIEGVFGSRMMGAGFGGCTINLVESNYIKSFMKTNIDEYRKVMNKDVSIYVCSIEGGTRVI